ncbi:hypothetical protein S7335_3228 [Synechococcus sp. PCC 7335]|nr:hypothetical protein S7335_3228 [Synechococcus sp. PCC 7335]
MLPLSNRCESLQSASSIGYKPTRPVAVRMTIGDYLLSIVIQVKNNLSQLKSPLPKPLYSLNK